MGIYLIELCMPHVNRREYIAAVSAIGALGMAGCLGEDNGDNGNGDGPRIGVSQHISGGAWVAAFFEAGQWYAEEQGIDVDIRLHNDDTAEQIQHIEQFVTEDFDGIVAAPFDEAVDSAIENADEAGIPVFCANDPGTTSVIKTYTGFDNYLAGEECAELMLEAFEERDGGDDEYEILHVRGPFTQAGNARTEGFIDRMDEEDNVELVAELESEWTEESAQSVALDWLSANDPPNGIYSSNMSSGYGTYRALEQLDLAVPFDEDDHIVLTQPDGGPQIHPLIEEGYIYAAVDQPNYFYVPLAMRQCLNYLEEGEDSIPEEGDEVTEDEIEIEPTHIDEIDQELWTEPVWAPASVEERDGHPHILTQAITITQENVDDDLLWGNIWDEDAEVEQ
jgi:ABC-type sugar transport system substrate-binding protein